MPEAAVAPPDVRPKRQPRPKPVTPVRPAEAVASATTSEPHVSAKTTEEARDLLNKLSQEGAVPAFMTANFQRILRENGLNQEDINKMRPEEAAEWLRSKAKSEDEQPESETDQPAPSPTENPETPPAPKVPEAITPERQRSEVERMASSIIHRHAESSQNSDSLTPTQEATIGIRSLNPDRLGNGTYRGSKGIPARATGTPDIRITVDGEVKILDSILSGDDESFTCFVANTNGVDGTPIATIPRSEVFRGQVLAVEQILLGSSDFTQAEKVVLGAWISTLKNEPTTESPENINGAIKEVAQKNGILTTDDLRTMHEVLIKQAETRDLTPEQSVVVQLARLRTNEALEHIVATSNILDRENLTEFLNATGNGPEQIQVGLEIATKALASAQSELSANPDSPKHKSVVEDLAMEVYMRQRVVSAFVENGAVDTYFKSAEDGTLNTDQASTISEAFRKGDLETVMKNMPGFEDDASDPSKKKKRVDMMGFLKKKGSMFGLITMFLMFEGMKSVTNSRH